MHEEYRDTQLKQLRDQQVRFAPRNKKLEQIENAEKLLSEIVEERNYSYDFLCYRITGYRPEQSSRRTMCGNNVLYDLRLFVEDLSEAADVTVEEISEPVHTVIDLSKMFNVSTKTISRWREQGLVSRRFVFGTRRRIGFLHSSVERFVNRNRDRIRRGERFSQLSDDEKGEIIERARQASESGSGLSEVVRQLAEQMHRSQETIRYTLKKYDSHHPGLAIFPNHRGALTPADKRSIFTQYHRGTSIACLCKLYGRTRSSIQRILSEMRVSQIIDLPLDYTYNPEFEQIGREAEFVAEMPPSDKTARKTKIPENLPSYLIALYDVPLLTPAQERHLFRKLNYLKHKANRLRNNLNHSGNQNRILEEIERVYDAAVQTKNLIVQANLRLVVSIAKRHIKQKEDFFGLISDGNMALIRAVEKFDYSRGNKFSTYASWAIMKNYARTIPSEFKHQDRFRTTTDDLFLDRQDDRLDPYVEESAQRVRRREIGRILNRLDDREQKIITARFGLERGASPRTLKQVGEEIGVTKERVRQIESRALDKLRAVANESKMDAELGE